MQASSKYMCIYGIKNTQTDRTHNHLYMSAQHKKEDHCSYLVVIAACTDQSARAHSCHDRKKGEENYLTHSNNAAFSLYFALSLPKRSGFTLLLKQLAIALRTRNTGVDGCHFSGNLAVTTSERKRNRVVL